MSCYGPLAEFYDRLTNDVSYSEFADYYEAEFKRNGGEFRLLLDLCCGTGTLTGIMTQRGYEMISVDASAEMLQEAMEKSAGLTPPPLFLCQDAAELDLYGTVDAAFCSLDGINYIYPEDLPGVFHRLHLFVRPGGLVIFDIRTPEFFRSIDGEVFVDETDDMLCLWRADFSEEDSCMIYGMDIFSKKGKLWSRESEEHVEFSHEPESLSKMLENAGFFNVSFTADCPQGNSGRLFFTATRSLEY